MVIDYLRFKEILYRRIKNGSNFYIDLVKTVIDNPSRYCGLFRLSNAKTKLIQNVTQSKEIKFGDFMEEIFTIYFEKMGFRNLPKDLGCDEHGDRLNADQVFTSDGILCLIEQKIRDDHDSTKKRGQYSNFLKKINHLRKLYPSYRVSASMWFIDDSLVKNKNYYIQEMKGNKIELVTQNLFYGGEAFIYFERYDIWEEIIGHLTNLRIENSDDIINIPDFDTSEEIFEALVSLDDRYWRKLMSNSNQFETLRKELFSTGFNLERAKKARNNF